MAHTDRSLNRKSFCLTSTEARLLIRDGRGGGGERKSEGSIAGANPEDQRCRGREPVCLAVRR